MKNIFLERYVWIDPPSGWKYGFPALWDKEQQSDIKQFLIQKGYPEKDVEFASRYMRMWLPNEE